MWLVAFVTAAYKKIFSPSHSHNFNYNNNRQTRGYHRRQPSFAVITSKTTPLSPLN